MSGSIALNTIASIYSNSFKEYLRYSETIGGNIFEQSLSVDKVFKTTLDLIETFGKYKKPLNPLAEQYLTDPLFQEINEVVSFEGKASDHIFQITLISKTIKVFEWVKELDEEKFVSKLHKYVQFYRQKAQCEIENLGRTHFEWLKNWNECYEEFSIFIMNFFKNGVSWTGTIVLPLNHVLGDSNMAHKTETHQALLKDISKGESVQTRLHRTSESTNIEESFLLPEVFEKVDQKWLIKNHRNNHKRLVLNTARREDTIIIQNCDDCTVVIENHVNLIHLHACRQVTILYRNTSKLEAMDCKDCNFHCFEKIDELDITSCENCGVYLSDKSLESSIVTTKSSGITVNFPFEDGLYQSFKIAEQLKTRILPRSGIETTVIQ